MGDKVTTGEGERVGATEGTSAGTGLWGVPRGDWQEPR